MNMFPPEVSRLTNMRSSGAQYAEDLLPSLAYRELVASLIPLTALGVFEEGGLATALAVARLVDRGRIQRSGLSAGDLVQALAAYRRAPAPPALPIERALEQAITLVPQGELIEQA